MLARDRDFPQRWPNLSAKSFCSFIASIGLPATLSLPLM